MNTYIKIATCLAIGSLAYPLAAEATAETDEMVVSARTPSVGVWVEHLSSQLQDKLTGQRRINPQSTAPTGIVQISFRFAADGVSADTSVFRGSGSSRLDRLSLRAVKRLSASGPFPRSFDSDQQFLANIVVANDKMEARRLHAELTESEAARIAGGRGSEFLALNLGYGSPG